MMDETFIAGITLIVETYSQMFQSYTHSLTDIYRVLSDPSGKNDRIHTIKYRHVFSELFT